MEITGTVIHKKVAKGSKSEHAAISMEWNGKSYLLRQRGKNAFNNPELEALVGKRIEASVDVTGNVFFVRKYTILP